MRRPMRAPTRGPWLPTLVALATACGDGASGARDSNPSAERGSIAVSWALELEDGTATSCADRGLTDAWVSIGGEPVVVPCGEDERVVFSDLTFGTYPVVIRLRGPSGVAREEHVGNTVLDARSVRDFTHTFVFTDAVVAAGRIRVRWFIDGNIAVDGCARIGGERVRIRTREGAIESFSATSDCVDGERTFEDLRPGNYQLLLDLIDPIGEVISTRPTSELLVSSGLQSEASVSFSTGPVPIGDLLTEWTVNGEPSMNGCRTNDTVQIVVSTSNPTGGRTVVRTSSTACMLGRLELSNLETTPLYVVTFQLIDGLAGPLPSSAEADVELVPAMTTTVTADLEDPRP